MEKHVENPRFHAKILTESERALFAKRPRAETLAAFFAAKEAVSKALGTGIGVIRWTDIEIRHKKSGQPFAVVTDRKAGKEYIFAVSITHDAGIAAASAQRLPEDRRVFPPSDLARIPRRDVSAHKYSAGTALLVGASPGMTGSIRLAAMAAMRAGAGMCRVAVPPSAMTAVEISLWEPVVRPYVKEDSADLMEWAKKAHSIGIGPGLGFGKAAEAVLEAVFSSNGCPIVADADALRWLAENLDYLQNAKRQVVLTPHDGELRGLLGEDPTTENVAAFAEKYDLILVRKGPNTTVFGKNRQWKNTSGSAALATGGTGDVLTGTIAGLLAQGLSVWDAATVGVYAHGLAADMASEGRDSGLVAGDLLRTLPAAIHGLKEEEK